MSAMEALCAARAAGITMMLDGEGLILEASTEPPPAVLEAISRHKSAILDLLRPLQGEWTAEQWRAYFHKHKANASSHRGSPRTRAGALALDGCVIEWLNRHPAPSTPGYCAWCDRPETSGSIVLPFGTAPGTHTWLHAGCWPAWHQARRADAIAALSGLGIGEARTND